MITHDKLVLGAIALTGSVGLAGTFLAGRGQGEHAPANLPATVVQEVPDTRAARQGEMNELAFEQTFSDMDGLDVEMDDADVVFREGRAGEIRVSLYLNTRGDREWAREVFEGMEFRAEEAGGSLYVQGRDPELDRRRRRRGHGVHARLVLDIPRDLRVRARTGDGDISGDVLDGDIELASGDGDISIGHAEGRSLTIATGDGNIRVDHVFSEHVRVRTGDGDISLRDLRADLEAHTGDGDLLFEFSEARAAEIATGDGDVTLIAPRTLRASFRLEGEDLEIAPGMELTGRVRGDLIDGSMNGGGPLVRVRVGDGTISLRGN